MALGSIATMAYHSNGEFLQRLLELLAPSVTIYITILKMGKGSHILVFTDSSSALGWIYKASFDTDNAESHYAVSRWIVRTLVSNEKYLYSQQSK